MKYFKIIITENFSLKTVSQFLQHISVSQKYIINLRKNVKNVKVNNIPSPCNTILNNNDILEIAFEPIKTNIKNLQLSIIKKKFYFLKIKACYNFVKIKNNNNVNQNFTLKNMLKTSKTNAEKPCENNQKLKFSTHTTTTQSVLLNIPQLDIVFEDDFILLVNKPQGLSSMPNKSHYDINLGKLIISYLSEKQKNPILRLPYRLDFDTCGIIVVYKNQLGSSIFSKTHFNKKYHAIIHGHTDSKIINLPIYTEIDDNGINKRKRIIDKRGKISITHVNTLIRFESSSLIECSLETGRTHQIRVHLSSQNNPLLGDSLYGNCANDQVSHTALICKKVAFIHPITHNEITFEVDYPDNFKILLI